PQLTGYPSGGQDPEFPYAGTVQATVFWDLDPLIHLPGLAFSVGGAWSTGHNLAVDDVGSIFTIQSAYTAPNNGANNLTLGEMYVQQQLWNNTLVVAAG